jgi:hypothetical protein
MDIRPIEAVVVSVHVERRADMTELMGVLRDYVDAPKTNAFVMIRA